jgi:hypothetical protein
MTTVITYLPCIEDEQYSLQQIKHEITPEMTASNLFFSFGLSIDKEQKILRLWVHVIGFLPYMNVI